MYHRIKKSNNMFLLFGCFIRILSCTLLATCLGQASFRRSKNDFEDLIPCMARPKSRRKASVVEPFQASAQKRTAVEPQKRRFVSRFGVHVPLFHRLFSPVLVEWGVPQKGFASDPFIYSLIGHQTGARVCQN